MTIENSLFQGRIASGATIYVPVPIRNGALGVHIGWPDAVSSATITLELSSRDGIAVTVAGTGDQWFDSLVVIVGPAASAAGSAPVNVENCRQRLARLKIVTAAVTTLDIRDGTGPGL